MRLADLIEQRTRLAAEMRAQHDAAEASSDGMTSEEFATFQARDAQLQQMDAEIATRQRAIDAEQRITPADQREAEERARQGNADELADPTLRERIDSDEYRDALTAMANGSWTEEQRSTLNTVTDAEGGFAVPEQWGGLYEGLRDVAIIRGLATVITTERAGRLHIPTVSTDASEPTLIAEEGTFGDDAEELGEVTLDAYKYGKIRKASDEMISDSLFDVEGFVGRRLGEDLGLRAEKAYTLGTGSDQPRGLFSGATVASGLGAVSAVGYDTLIDLEHSVPVYYRRSAVWVCHDKMAAALRKLKDADGRPLWQPSLQAGQPGLINGYPMECAPFAPEPGLSAKSLLFGNVKRGFLIRDTLGITIMVLRELYAGTGHVGWRGHLRTDSEILDARAMRTIQQAAS